MSTPLSSPRADLMRTGVVLVAVLGISSAPWIFQFAVVSRASEATLEGLFYFAGLIGALSFTLTAPTASVAARYVLSRNASILATGVLFVLLSLPAVSGEVVLYSSSFLPLFLPNPVTTDATIPAEMAQASLLSIAWYGFVFFSILRAGRLGRRTLGITATALFLCSFGAIAFRALDQ